ncbi:NitT/TauT family transport system ATP-binding protein [Actinomadura meyerae]|uniref:NitT/TauT family transport system ATP-binding protein n=1 Tax=Actinomadura meyerae TaxID=240840 RepID=A0A239EVW9_9ACTN|nr:ABC transporter ATP-binding protein [Actinomadura meyerae]SNS48428.1 NitT/TauT family transport system ATP-binding protein [Actinomadura meyerae]
MAPARADLRRRAGGEDGTARPLRAAGLAKEFPSRDGTIVALDGVDLTIAPGEFVSVLGPSGCGKSTMLTIMAGLDAPTGGEVTIGDRPVTGPLLEAGVMFQRDLLLDWRTCEDNVLLQFQMRGLATAPHREHARELLEMVGMSRFARRFPRELSGGMRQRVALCRALVHRPPLLFMDEPFGALDALTRENLNTELGGLAARAGTSVLFVTHGIDEAAFLADRVVVMSPRPGRIVGEVRIDLPRPRPAEVRETPEFVACTGRLRRMLTHGRPEAEPAGAGAGEAVPDA